MTTAHCGQCGTTQPLDEAGRCPAGHGVVPHDGPPAPEPEPWILELEELVETEDGPAPAASGARDPDGPARGHDRPDGDGDRPGPPAPADDPADDDVGLAALEAAVAELDARTGPPSDPDPDDQPARMSREEMIAALQEAPATTASTEVRGAAEPEPGPAGEDAEAAGPSGAGDPLGRDGEGRRGAGSDAGETTPDIDPGNFTARGGRVTSTDTAPRRRLRLGG